MILKPKKIKSATLFHFSTSICHEVMGPDAMILFFLKLFHSTLSPSLRSSLAPPLHFLLLVWYHLQVLSSIADLETPKECSPSLWHSVLKHSLLKHSSRLEARFLILWDLNKNWMAFPTSHFVEIQWCPQGFFKFQGVRVLVPSSSDFLLPHFSSLLIQAT